MIKMENDPLVKEFIIFSQENRKKFGVTKEKELWPLQKIYSLLKDQLGGFILDLGEHATLGIKVEAEAEDESWYTVTYRDPFHPDLQLIRINSKTLRTNNDKLVKVQWFGNFDFLEKRKLHVGFLSLSKTKYKLVLPLTHKKLIQKNNYLCGDISAFFAMKSSIKYSIRPVTN